MSSAGDLPLIITIAGPQPTPPSTIRQTLVSLVAADNPDYTSDLPAGLIEDVASTDTGALVLLDSGRVDSVNAVGPRTANAYILSKLGQQFGVQIGQKTNTSVFLVFTANSNIGFAIAKGFTVSDGTYQYVTQEGAVITSSGMSDPVFAVATQQGSWDVPPGSVTQLVTSLPSTVTMTVTNPNSGVPGIATGETQSAYRARVLQAQLAASQGMPRYLKTLIGQVIGVQTRLISARQANGGWEILVGGGDPYDVANAIFESLFDINDLVASVINITGLTNANPGVVTTGIAHGLTAGQTNVHIAGVVGTSGVNGGPYTVNVLTPTTFSFGVNTTSSGAYVSGGVVTPNARNVSVSINDYPDIYVIPIVVPLQQIVTMTVTWNTDSPNFVNPTAIAQAAIPALVGYVNSVAVGQPMNVFEMNAVFQQATQSILDPNLLTRLAFAVNIAGIAVSPVAGTGILNGDPESYLTATTAGIVVNQG